MGIDNLGVFEALALDLGLNASNFNRKIKKFTNKTGQELAENIRDETPVRTEKLKNGWEESQPEYDTYIVEDQVEYATLVNDGHATKNGGIVPGSFMVEKGIEKTKENMTSAKANLFDW
ncbi:HK97 gp10 family phage protein [Clostridioides difficile]|uniref:HK97 gp10 family phage protein n=1 Tax=Clostridioides difficile TaxID=1496 RepID=UPI0030802460